MGRPVHLYAIALGSNRPHGRHGAPEGVVRAVVEELSALGTVEAISRIHRTAAIGPAGRSFANAAVILATDLEPVALLAALKRIERRFGRRPGRRWGPRVLDLDIILWSGGAWQEPGLLIPHAEFRARHFVLQPLAELAPDWRDPITGATMRQLLYRRRSGRPVDPRRAPT